MIKGTKNLLQPISSESDFDEVAANGESTVPLQCLHRRTHSSKYANDKSVIWNRLCVLVDVTARNSAL